MAILLSIPTKLNINFQMFPCFPVAKNRSFVRAYCAPLQQPHEQLGSTHFMLRSKHFRCAFSLYTNDVGIMCEPCNGKGWLVCDFCKGQKTNVKAENSRIYRRCPSCRAVGYVLCPKCKVFKCITFPDYSDGGL